MYTHDTTQDVPQPRSQYAYCCTSPQPPHPSKAAHGWGTIASNFEPHDPEHPRSLNYRSWKYKCGLYTPDPNLCRPLSLTCAEHCQMLGQFLLQVLREILLWVDPIRLKMFRGQKEHRDWATHTLARYLDSVVNSYGLAVVDFCFWSLAESWVVEVFKMGHFETLGVNNMDRYKLGEGRLCELNVWGLGSALQNWKPMCVESESLNTMKWVQLLLLCLRTYAHMLRATLWCLLIRGCQDMIANTAGRTWPRRVDHHAVILLSSS